MEETTRLLIDKRLEVFQEGQMLLFDKPLNWTSFDVVNRVRIALCRYFDVRKLKVGHAGTLDPLATGLLIICTGKFTKRIDDIQAQEKIYTGTIRIGETTPTYDLESEPDTTNPIDHINEEMIEIVRKQFLGPIMQQPPIFSAIKKDGKRSYDLARKGIDAKLEPRAITINSLSFDTSSFPDLGFEVNCSKGTYIRSLAYDIGLALGSGAYLKSLHRAGIGSYSNDDAWVLQDFLDEFKISQMPKDL